MHIIDLSQVYRRGKLPPKGVVVVGPSNSILGNEDFIGMRFFINEELTDEGFINLRLQSEAFV